MISLRRDATTFRSDRSWTFALAPDALWERMTAVEEYPSWWSWLERFRPIGGFEPGARWSCTVVPPVPYDVSFSLLIDRVEPMREVRARVVGDIRGEATLTLDEVADGCTARLRSQLAPSSPLLRGVGSVARPLVEWSHDWVLDQGQRQFVERALDPT